MFRIVERALVVAMLLLAATASQAGDKLTIALSSGGRAWDFAVAGFGQRMGFFAEQGIDVEIAATDNSTASVQAVIAGSADIANAGVAQFMGAALSGAPVRMISSSFVGTSDWLWYVRSDSPIKSFKDVNETTTIGVSSLGCSCYVIVEALLEQYGAKANVVAAGSSAAVITEVMTGQLNVGTDGNGLLGVPQYDEGDLRPIAFGRELDLMRNVSLRGLIVQEDALARNRDLFARFLKAYQKTVDWMYSDPKAVEWFAEETGSSLAEARRVKEELYPAGAMTVGDVTGLDISIRQGLATKRIERAPSEEEIARMFDTVWKPETM